MVVELKVGLRFFFGTTDSTPRSRWRKGLADGVGKFGFGGCDGNSWLVFFRVSLQSVHCSAIEFS